MEVVRKPRKKRAFPCPVCDKVYTHKRTLDDHVKVKHKEYEMLQHTEQEHEPQVDKASGAIRPLEYQLSFLVPPSSVRSFCQNRLPTPAPAKKGVVQGAGVPGGRRPPALRRS